MWSRRDDDRPGDRMAGSAVFVMVAALCVAPAACRRDAGARFDDELVGETAGDARADETSTPVEPPVMGPVMTELLASNDASIADEDGERPDWIELHNPHGVPISLDGFHLTDDPARPTKWTLPDEVLDPWDYRIVFASGKDRAVAGQPLHTNFKLDADGEYLALVDPDRRVVQAWAPYPPQLVDISFGTPNTVETEVLVAAGQHVQWRIANAAEGSAGWQATSFDALAAGWAQGPTGVGFEVAFEQEPAPHAEPLANSVDDWSDLGEQGAAGWTYGYWNRTADPDGAYQVGDFIAFPHDGGGHGEADWWDGWRWDWFGGDPPWTTITRDGAHPNSADQGDEHWPMRRWTASVAGTLRVEWHLHKTDPGGQGVTGHVFHRGAEVDSHAVAGDDEEEVTRTLWIQQVALGDAIDFALDPTGPGGDAGSMSDSARHTARIWVSPDLRTLIETDVADEMHGVSPGLWLRAGFDLADPSAFNRMALAIELDDGFVAWLNGQRIASLNAPPELGWDSTASAERTDAAAVVAEGFRLDPYLDLLEVGANTLAIHGLNLDASDPDALIRPALEVRSVERLEDVSRYFATPTPGEDNGAGVTSIGPRVHSVTRNLLIEPGEAVVVEAHVDPTLAPVAWVSLRYRVAFGEERAVEMRDDGMTPDSERDDGVFCAAVPLESTAPGEMVRWMVRATDAVGASTRSPAFEDPSDSEEYFGGMVADPTVVSALAVLHWFAETPEHARTHSGTRTALFFDGELYDNVHADVHGQSSLGFAKRSHDLDFPRDHRFRLAPELRRMKDLNLLSNWADKSKLRNTLGYEVYRDAGVGYHLAFPMRVQLNGAFYALYDLVEDGDERWLERLGLDPRGALYKMYDSLESVAEGEKKTRKDEDKSDLQALIDGTLLEGSAQDAFVYDQVNVPAMVDFLAAMVVTGGRDCCHKNYYAYRDTEGTGQWWYLPWDVDLTFGRHWNADDHYFDDNLHWDTGVFVGSNSGLTGMLLGRPELVQMYLRRVRTLMDEQVQPPGTPVEALHFENRADALLAELGQDAWLDYQAWPMWGQDQTPAEAVEALKSDYLAPRRVFLYEAMSTGVTLDHALLSGEPGGAIARFRVPVDDGLGAQWTAPGFDDSGWTEGPMGIGYERDPGPYAASIGTAVAPQDLHPEATALQVRLAPTAPGPGDIDGLTLRVKYDDGFVAWLNGVEIARRNVEGAGAPGWNQTAADHPDDAALFWEDIDVSGAKDLLAAPDPVLAVQVVNVGVGSSDLLLLIELVEGVPSGGGGPIPGAQQDPVVDFGVIEAAEEPDESYIQLVNNDLVAVDVSGWHLTGAVDYTLAPGTVLPPGTVLYLSPDVNAFRTRSQGPGGGMGLFVQGDWTGQLDPGGSPLITLRDGAGTIVSQP